MDYLADPVAMRAMDEHYQLQPGSLDFLRTITFRADRLVLILSIVQHGLSGAIWECAEQSLQEVGVVYRKAF